MPPLKTLTLDSNTFALREGSKIARRNRELAPPYTERLKGDITRQDFGLYQQIQYKGPISLNESDDQKNVIAWRKGVLLRGPQRIAPTFSLGATTWKVTPGAGFFDSALLGKLMVHGFGAANDDEPVGLFSGGSSVTDATLNADDAANLNNVVGLVEAVDSGTGTKSVYAVLNAVTAIGGDNSLTLRTTNGTTWARNKDGATAENITAGTYSLDRIAFAVPRIGTPQHIIYCIYSSTTFAVSYEPANVLSSSAVTLTGTLTPILDATAAPRGFANWRTPTGTMGGALLISTNKGLYYVSSIGGTSAALVHQYKNPGGSHTGRIHVADNGVYFTDGDLVGVWHWVGDGGDSEVIYFQKPPLVLAKLGDATAVWKAQAEENIVYAAFGGLASSRNAWIARIDISTSPTRWYCFYEAPTAQRAIMAMFESTQNDGTRRLHIFEESAAGGDQDPLNFEKLDVDPLEDSAWKYNGTTPTILFPQEFPLGNILPVGWLTVQVDADDLSANEKISIKDGQSGDAPANSQDITSTTSPPQVWVDKTDGLVGVGVSALSQQIEVTLNGTAGATPGPTVNNINVTYRVKGLKPDATSPEEFDFLVDLDASKGLSGFLLNPYNVYLALQTTADKLTSVALTLPVGEVVYGSVTLPESSFNPQLQEVFQQAPAGGIALVRFTEDIR